MPKETKHNAQRGFTVLELTIVMVVSSLLLVPLLKLAFTSVGGNRDQQTEAAMEQAIDALVAYADDNNGCLPYAADFEGGLPDTDLAGLPLTDTGVGTDNLHAGDLPWADLGLALNFRDGDFLRLQYYVVTAYTGTGANCPAGIRGREWNGHLQYVGSVPNPAYVYDTVAPSSTKPPRLFKITGTLAAGLHPADAAAPASDVTAALEDELLVVKRGPDIAGSANNQKDEISIQNVFVLVAVGKNRNAALDRRYIRDANHAKNGGGGAWTLGKNPVDGVVFSMTHDVSGTDSLDHGDDTLRVMSFIEYKSRLAEFGKIMQPICEDEC